MSYMDFSSWPREQEQHFVVFEQRQAESQRKAYTLAAIVGAIALIFGVGVYAGVSPSDENNKKFEKMNSTLSKCSKDDPKCDQAPSATPTPTPTPTPAPAPAPVPAADKAAAPASAPAAAPAGGADQKK